MDWIGLDDFRWESHINAVCSKVSSRLYSSNSSNGQEFPQMIYCISTLLSFGQCLNAGPLNKRRMLCVVWHHNLTASQSDKLESLQKRAYVFLVILQLESLTNSWYPFEKLNLCLKEEHTRQDFLQENVPRVQLSKLPPRKT